MKRSIEVKVSPAGDISIEAIGFRGSDCEQATKFLEEVLGAVNQKEKKPEYHQQNRTKHQQRLGS